MNGNKYSDNELHLMSYQELRKLAILLQLPANIKKEYMISMILAHQKGDGCTKIAIANKIMEERKVKRMSNKGKHSKSFMLSSSPANQQIPTDLSLATKHEFETRFSYVAHYTSKENVTSGISRIIKQEAEVSRRNRSIIHQTRKPTRKLSTVDRTEIMLPRNHSLTTPVRLMPQSERNYIPQSQYEKSSGLPMTKNHYQDTNSYNSHFHGEYSNAIMHSSTHELCRNEPYWPGREVYNNSLMPILSSLLTPNPDTMNSSVYASQYTSQNIIKGPSSFQQGVYEKYIKSGNAVENQTFQSGASNSSTVTINNHYYSDTNNCNSSQGCRSYIVTKSDADFEINSTPNEIDCQHYSRREDTLMRNSNGNQECVVDFYLPRSTEAVVSPHATPHVGNVENLTECNEECFRGEGKAVVSLGLTHRSFELSSVPSYKCTENDRDGDETTPAMSTMPDYESVYIEEDKFWEEANTEQKKSERERIEKENYVEGFLNMQTQESLLSDVSGNSADLSPETDSSDPLAKSDSKENNNYLPVNFPRCRYLLGHDKFPESPNRSNAPSITLPSFLSTFCTNGHKGYSVCRNSFTETTETHLSPIMTCAYVSQFGYHTSTQQTASNNPGNTLVQRQWLYSYPESQAPFSLESTTYASWDEYPDMGNKIIARNNGHEVQVVKCRKHGCHYLYSMANPCN